MLAPSAFFERVPDFKPELLGLPSGDAADTDDRAVALVNAVVTGTLIEFYDSAGLPLPAPLALPDPGDARAWAALDFLLRAGVLALQSNRVALNAQAAHNPDVQGGDLIGLDLVRLIRRAARANAQQARKLLRGGSPWLEGLRARR